MNRKNKISAFAHDPKTAAGKPGPNPVFIIDSQKVAQLLNIL
jgi:hypothetical protein